MAIINFYDETIGFIESLGYHVKDIDFCQIIRSNYSNNLNKYFSKVYQFSFDDFKKNANFSYDNENEVIDRTLKIVFKDSSWIERFSYTGGQYWEFYFCAKKRDDLMVQVNKIDFIKCNEDDIQKNLENRK